MSTNTLSFTCPCCNQILDSYVQESTVARSNGRIFATCKTVGCDYREVTLSPENWLLLETDETMQESYRGMYERCSAY